MSSRQDGQDDVLAGSRFKDVLASIESGKPAALEDLKQMLSSSRQNLQDISDSSIHYILEYCFRFASRERSVWVKGPRRRPTRDPTTNNLQKAASTLRWTVQFFIGRMRTKSVRATIGHIVQTLPTAKGDLCAPLTTDYLKLLEEICAYQPHVEHMASKTWLDTVGFLSDVFKSMTSEDGVEASSRSPYSAHGTAGQRTEIVNCLRLLVIPSNCPLNEVSEDILSLMCDILLTSRETTVQNGALQTINTCLKRYFHNSAFVDAVTRRLLPLLRGLCTRFNRGAVRDRAAEESKTELLVALMYLRPRLMALAETSSSDDLSSHVDGLFEAIFNEYSANPVKDHLSLEDLFLYPSLMPDKSVMPMRLATCSLRAATHYAEIRWTTVSHAAFLLEWLQRRRCNARDGTSFDADNRPIKRLKRTTSLIEFTEHLNSSAALSTKKCVLQVYCFLTSCRVFEQEELVHGVAECFRLMSSDDVALLDWAMMSLTCFATQPQSTSPALRDIWLEVWKLCLRNVTASSSCRSACHLAQTLLASGCVRFEHVQESIDLMVFAASVNGPSTVCDSSLSLWMEVTKARSKYMPGQTAESGYDQMIDWFYKQWDPSSFESRPHAHQLNVEAPPHVTSHVLNQVLGQPSDLILGAPFPNLARLGQAWLWSHRTNQLSKWLLQVQASYPEEVVTAEHLITKSSSAVSRASSALANTILGTLSSQLEKVSQRWADAVADRASHVNNEMVQVAFGLCLVISHTAHILTIHYGKRMEMLTRKGADFVQQVIRFATRPGSMDGDTALLSIIVHFMPQLSTQEPRIQIIANLAPIAATVNSLLEALETQNLTKHSNGHADDIDLVDEEFSTSTNKVSQNLASRESRDHVVTGEDQHAFTAAMLAYMHLARDLSRSPEDHDAEDDVSSKLLTHVQDLPLEEVMATSPLLERLLLSQLDLKVESAAMLLSLAIARLLTSYLWRRCERTLCLIVKFMIGTVAFWTNQRFTEMHEMGSELYSYFIGTVAKSNLSSTDCGVLIADLLFKLLLVEPDFADSIQAVGESVRTSLFQLLKTSDTPVQHYIAERLPHVFGTFTLSQHGHIYEDIIEVLPSDVANIEGIYARLVACTEIGTAWNSLLRQCLYNIFETAGLVPEVERNARTCITIIARRLGFSGGQDLFRLFSSQLLSNWLDAQTLESVPYRIFGYGVLQDFVGGARDDIVSLSIVRGTAEVEQVGHTLQMPVGDLITEAFAKAVTRCIAQDFSMQKSTTSDHQAEQRVRAAAGDDKYRDFFRRDFAEIIGLFFLHLANEDGMDKQLALKEAYAPALKTLQAINKIGRSASVPASSQQPSWTPKNFLNQTERACRRVGKAVSDIWTANLVVRVARMLFNDMHAAFGPLHICRVIERIKILVALSGGTSETGYPLEMLLYGLRRFATDKHSAEYALPVIQHLLQRGATYLSVFPTTSTSISVSIFLSMRDLLESTQDSTTQESAHRDMLTKASTFRDWLCKWTDRIHQHMQDQAISTAFSNLINAARASTNRCSGSKGTPEAELLLILMKGLEGSEICLDETTAGRCLAILCKDFLPPPSLSEDILGDGALAARYATAVWKALHLPIGSKSFTFWASRTLGQAFLYTGRLEQDIRRESTLVTLSDAHDASNEADDHIKTKAKIITLLGKQLHGEDSALAGRTEMALAYVLRKYERNEEFAMITQSLPGNWLETFLGSGRANLTDVDAYQYPKSDLRSVFRETHESTSAWARHVMLALISLTTDEPVLKVLGPLMDLDETMAETLFPYTLHLVLSRAIERSSSVRQVVSDCFNEHLNGAQATTTAKTKLLLDALLYLRGQRIKNERTVFDRNDWVQTDLQGAAKAAETCGMHKTALLFSELAASANAPSAPRRASKLIDNVANTIDAPANRLLGSILKAIDEPDGFYGVEQVADLDTIADRLEYEGDGIQSLLYHGAQLDSSQKLAHTAEANEPGRLLTSLIKLNLNSLVAHLATMQSRGNKNTASSVGTMRAAMSLGQWDLPTSTDSLSADLILYRTFQSLYNFEKMASVRNIILQGVTDVNQLLVSQGYGPAAIGNGMPALASLAAVDGLLSAQLSRSSKDSSDDLFEAWPWMASSSPASVAPILLAQEALTSIVASNKHLQDSMRLPHPEARLREAYANLASSKVYRKLDMLQESLTCVTYLSKLVAEDQSLSVSIGAAVKEETAEVLWRRGEHVGSIKTLQNLTASDKFRDQAIAVGRSGLLADLAHHISYARLEKPDDILSRYLQPALKSLNDKSDGTEAGKVFHEYATYCHTQLENPDLLDDLQRTEKNKRQRAIDMTELRSTATSSPSATERRQAERELSSVKKWHDLDETELRRLKSLRQKFLMSGLENYLRSLAASDNYDTDIIRFLSLWLAHADDPIANGPVGKHAPNVPSRKFIPLMNQIGSRLQESGDEFQEILSNIVLRVCNEHPYHGMYHVFAGSRTTGGHDSQAQSRQLSATRIAKQLEKSRATAAIWHSIARSNELYNKLAKLRGNQIKQNAKLQMKDFEETKRVMREVPALEVPPITLAIEVREDMKYDNVPKVYSFYPNLSIPGGISAPKIVICKATNGRRFRQLFKGGSDDLRQDAIMEQVFEQVTALLKFNKATRQRGLRIRTYKVIPLDAVSGAIEFVEPTMSIGEYLEPAHHRYHPKDLKWSACRQKIADVQDQALQQKVNNFKDVCSKISPVLRHFFFERFEDPDDWFDRRLAYTRSTAAISILGHVLGLGDRHCHNILLDTSTGEVVHIDLGVAFEAGRILPKPEMVPFRLTRDIIDGFGILKTEGVFRRCCEFTLEALRQNKDTILTLLNVLRYDPLYSWSVSPLRAKRLQKEQESRAMEEESNATSTRGGQRRSRGGADEPVKMPDEPKEKKEDQGGEADRALSTVGRKLAGGLSVSATVNELIQQATDEKNLAQLFHGWSAFA